MSRYYHKLYVTIFSISRFCKKKKKNCIKNAIFKKVLLISYYALSLWFQWSIMIIHGIWVCLQLYVMDDLVFNPLTIKSRLRYHRVTLQKTLISFIDKAVCWMGLQKIKNVNRSIFPSWFRKMLVMWCIHVYLCRYLIWGDF